MSTFILLRVFVESLLYPPLINLLLIAAGLIAYKRRRLALSLISFAVVTLYLACIPLVSLPLIHALSSYPPIPPQDLPNTQAQTIVILGGSGIDDRAEFGGPVIASNSLTRLRYGAFLHQRTGLPIVVSGGDAMDISHREADLMKISLEQDFGISADHILIENRSHTTQQNAVFTASLLKAQNINRVLLVTHDWHMPRAVAVFRQQGLEVIPAPTSDRAAPTHAWAYLLPNTSALRDTHSFLRETVSRLWYAVRY